VYRAGDSGLIVDGEFVVKKSKKRAKKKQSAYPNMLREVIGIAVIAIAVLFTLSFVSYYPIDNTVMLSSSETSTQNFIGPFGANLAAIFMHFIGYTAFFLPAVLLLLGGSFIMKVKLEASATKGIGVAGFLFGAVMLLHMLLPTFAYSNVEMPFSGGGFLGKTVANFLIQFFGVIGTELLSIAIIAISLVMIAKFSFANFFADVANVFSHIFAFASKDKSKAKKNGSPKILVRVKLPWQQKTEIPKETDDADLALSALQKLQKKKKAAKPLARAKQPVVEESFVPEIKVNERKMPKAPVKVEGMQAPLDILVKPEDRKTPLNMQLLAAQAQAITDCYNEFGIEGKVLHTNPGPVVNTFEFKPAPGVKYNRVVNLANELCLALSAESVRINRLSGKNTIGIEVPNSMRETIFFRELIESEEYQNSTSPLTIGLGKNIAGEPYISRLDEMPHLLIGGATGTGKSVCLNSIIASILYKSPPEMVKFIMVDPKQVELNLYEGLPHQLTKVVTHPKQAASALRWACEEMEVRYRKLSNQGVRNISGYNQLITDLMESGDMAEGYDALEMMPYIVIIIDELADLMMVASNEVEESLCRLAQKARAVGIHLIVATQRPSVDVLTGTIKANFPCRISFGVTTKVDSRVILDTYGAEDLLGKGDMLFMPPGSSRLMRLHGSLINEKEVAKVVAHLKGGEEPDYNNDILAAVQETMTGGDVRTSLPPDQDPLYMDAVNLVLTTKTASISNLQRKMRLGYARAARIVDMMEANGVIGPADGSKPREILMTLDD
jgi:S-DNA-T family DNA segregation ATPase FtsK/SpoIIIE